MGIYGTLAPLVREQPLPQGQGASAGQGEPGQGLFPVNLKALFEFTDLQLDALALFYGIPFTGLHLASLQQAFKTFILHG
jgi:hypothetical protein